MVADAVNALVGVGFTVTVNVVVGDTHAGVPGFATVKLTVFVSAAAVVFVQLTAHAPAVVPGAVMQPSQFHV